jgi:hypothetical protein
MSVEKKWGRFPLTLTMRSEKISNVLEKMRRELTSRILNIGSIIVAGPSDEGEMD